MDTDLLISIALIVFLLFLSAFFSGSETSLTAASRARLRQQAKDGNKRAETVEDLISDKEKLIGGILLGNNLVNILASAMATSVLISLFGDEGVVYATLIMTALVLIFAEVLPKTYAINYADKMALTVGPIIKAVVTVLSPIVMVVQKIVQSTLKLFGVRLDEVNALDTSREEIRGTIDLVASEGGIRKSHKDMLGGILDLDAVFVEDVMVHRKSMLMIDVNDYPSDIVEKVIASGHSRIPAYKGNSDEIVGILHTKDLLAALRRCKMNVARLNISNIVREPWFVPETTSLRAQMNAFRERQAHFALVVDEYGALMGLITLEDILEEIVGDISDEHDNEEEGFRIKTDGTILAEGRVTIRDLNRAMEWSLPDDEAVTIAGLVIDIAETIPHTGERYYGYDLCFEVLGRRRNQLTRIAITRASPATEDDSSEDVIISESVSDETNAAVKA